MRQLRHSLFLLVLQLTLLCVCRAFVPQMQGPQDTTARSKIGFLPLPIFYYTPETGFAGGAALLTFYRADTSDRTARPSSVMFDAIYTQKKQIILEVVPDIYLQQDAYRIMGSLIYIKYPQKFFGIGNNTPDSFEENYSSRAFRVSVDALHRISGNISGGISLFYESRTLSEFKPNGLLEPGIILGSRGGTTLGIGVVAQWDTRDNIFTPTMGRYHQFLLQTSSPKLGSDFDFSRLVVDMREYLSLTEETVLAAHALATVVSGSAPFHKLAELGGSEIMRGYYEGRYRDRKFLAAQLEYRYPIYWRFNGVVFAGFGDVAPTLSRFRLNDVKPSYGFGVRYMFDTDEKLSLRFDFGFGKNVSGVYITAGEAF